VKIDNIEILNEGLSRGKGVIALTAHVGNWELAGIVTSLLGYKITGVSIPYLNSAVTRIYKTRRKSKGMDVILTGSNSKGILKALRENKILAVRRQGFDRKRHECKIHGFGNNTATRSRNTCS